MANRDKSFDTELRKIWIFKKFKHMIPFVGKNYANTKNKLLLIGESCGLDVNDDNAISDEVKKTQIDWYNVTDKDLTPLQFHHTNIKGIFEDSIKSKHCEIATYKSIKASLSTVFKNSMNYPCNKLYEEFNYIAFTNYFQRPSLIMIDGKHKKNFNIRDKEIAGTTLTAIIKILKPKYIFFLSKRAWDAYSKNGESSYQKIFNVSNTGYGCHPTRGKKAFELFLTEKILKKKSAS